MQHQSMHQYNSKAGNVVRLPRDRASRADANINRRAFDAVAYAAALEILG